MIKNIDLDLMDTHISNFDITDDVNYNFENYMNMDNFVDYLKKENLYDNFKNIIDMYMRMYHKYDKEDIEKYSYELQENVVDFIKDTIDESIKESEED